MIDAGIPRYDVAFFGPQVQDRQDPSKWYFVSKIQHQRKLSFDQLFEMVSRRRDRPDDKRRLPSWSPVLYREGEEKRNNLGVSSISCLVLDYDDAADMSIVQSKWEQWAHIGHTSYSHALGKPKFRILVPLEAPILPENWMAVWAWAEQYTGRTIDKQCKDKARVYFLSCEGEGFQSWRNEGPLLNLSHLRPILRPKPMQRSPVRGTARYDVDPTARLAAGEALGGRLRGDTIMGVRCPNCGKNSVWWPVKPDKFTGWMCNHRNSCGGSGNISKLVG